MRSVVERVAELDRASVPTALEPLRPEVETELRRSTPEFAVLDFSESWEAGTLVLGDKAREGRLSVRKPLVELLQMQVFDEQVKLLLTDVDVNLQQLGLTLVWNRYLGLVAAVLRGAFPHLTSHDLADVVGETFKNLLQAVREGTFEPAGDLLAYLTMVGRRRAADLKRRQKVREAISFDEALVSLSSGPRDSTIDGRMEEKEFRQLLDTAIAQLPLKQRQTMASYVTHFPNSKNMSFLRQEVEKASGEDTTVEAVKRNLAVARHKVSAYLQTQGYTIGAGGEE